ncbi:uncharacterized protein K02A2.6-like [Uranotaenia lowii]|uniref:uncharacterized protein K02A2.6-like n=1 Tax=Uranotaenia lowii TaxID=190385 RepID=UPI0024789A11|nr:uncharacterized protein K02A2.6-like [Uranotaenia lowii]
MFPFWDLTYSSKHLLSEHYRTQLKNEAQSGKAKIEIIDSSNKKLHAYGSREPLAIECSIRVEIALIGSNKPKLTTTFHVIPRGMKSLLGRSTSSDIGLLSVGNINQFEKVQPFPKMPDVKVRFSIDRTVPPTKSAYYNVPAAYSPLWTATASKSWSWGPEQRKAFVTVKQRIIDCTISLGFFSEYDKTILYTDASPVALGAVLVQEESNAAPRVISFASKSLTPTERKYAQNQREALAAVWAVEHFSYFLLGRHFTLRTDAQGVAFILNRSRDDSRRALTRADGWALRLSPYRYDVEYVRGKENIADPPSRLYNAEDVPFDEESSPWEIATLEANAVEFLTETEIRNATDKDEILKNVMKALNTGTWSPELKRYQTIEKDLFVREGIIIKTGCAIIPKALQMRALEVAHEGNSSTAKMKSIMRQRVWWPGMPKDVTNWVESCRTCCINGKPERTTPMERISIPKTAWEAIALDFNGPYVKFGGILILVIIDYKSRYILAKPIKSTSFECTRKVLDDIFEKEGFPKTVKIDNGPPFGGKDFADYCKQRDITLVLSTPLFPQQNGLAESAMKLINKAMSVAIADKTNYNEELKKAVMAHNAAAHSITKVPPEELMYGRKIKRGLPLLLRNKPAIDDNLVQLRDQAAKQDGKQREDARRGARNCRTKPGDEVVVQRLTRMKGDSRFSPTRHTVIEERNGSLILSDKDGKISKRHVSQTKKVKPWRDSTAQSSTSEFSKTNSDVESPQPGISSRSRRVKRTPAFLNDYVQIVTKQ